MLGNRKWTAVIGIISCKSNKRFATMITLGRDMTIGLTIAWAYSVIVAEVCELDDVEI